MIRFSVTGTDLLKQLEAAIRGRTIDALTDVRCPEHGETVQSVTITGGLDDRYQFHFEACCETLIDAAQCAVRREFEGDE